MKLDTTRLMAVRPPKHYNNCKVSDLDPLSRSAVPREIEVVLPDADGSKVLAMWYGSPVLAVDDYVRIRRDTTDTNIYVVEGFGGGSGAGLDDVQVSKLYESDGGGPAWEVDADGDLSGDGDILPGGDTAGLFERVNSWQSPTDHLNVFSGWTWATYVGFGTPNTISLARPSLVQFLSNTIERAFAYVAADTFIAALCGFAIGNVRTGVRMDDGTNDNYVELWVAPASGLMELYLRHATGGVVTGPTQLWGGNQYLPQFVQLQIARSSTSYLYYASGLFPIAQYLGTTGALGWTATRLGLYHEHTGAATGADRSSLFESVRYS